MTGVRTGERSPVLIRILLDAIFVSLAVLTWPRLLHKIISLEWRIGDMRPFAYGLQAGLVCLAIISLVARRWTDSICFKLIASRKKLAFAAIGVLFSVVLGLIVVEMACRFFGLPFENKQHWTPSANAIARFDAELGWSYIPNLSTVQEFGSERRKVPVHFDDIGSRVRAPGIRHDPNAPTVLFVGDSYTMGHGLPFEETFVTAGVGAGFPLSGHQLGRRRIWNRPSAPAFETPL